MPNEHLSCQRCGAPVTGNGRLCARCLLQPALEPGDETTRDEFLRTLADADVPDLAGLVGNYKIIREIGRGGMGAVYLAERADAQFQKRVALKVIKRGMDTDSVLRRFANERQILGSLEHSNIARLFDAGTTAEGLPYFVMEHVDGIPIDQYCQAQGLSVAERLQLFRDVCAAISYAHGRLVVHRDIKCSNILVTTSGEPKLLDFGIGKVLDEGANGDPMVTLTEMRPMTPQYASPEQVRGEPVTTATDVYSLGVVLYELLTGKSPYHFSSKSPYDIARTITDTEPPSPSTAAQQIAVSNGSMRKRVSDGSLPRLLRGDLDNITLKALQKQPERRYASVEQFSEDIRRHLQARPVLARKDTIGYRARKFFRRNRTATLAAALLFVSLVGGIIATTRQAQRTRAEKARAERRFSEVRKLANNVLFKYHDAIKNLHGATRVREELVNDALVYLDSLARESSDDPALQRELAAAYERVGDVRGQARSASLGDRAGALESYQKALRIREALVAAEPRSVENRLGLAASYSRVGTQLTDTKDAKRGIDLIRKSLTLCSELAAGDPDNRETQHRLAETYIALGSAFEEQNDIPAALENARNATTIYEKLLASDRQDPRARRGLSNSYEYIGRASFLNDDVTGALENNQKALALREALHKEDLGNADLSRLLAISYQNNGDYRSWLKNIDQALDSFRKKLVLDEAALTADSANAQAREDVGYSSERMAELLIEKSDYAQALPYAERALKMYEQSVAEDPQNAQFGLRVVQAHILSGQTLIKLGRANEGQEEFRKSLELLRTISSGSTTMAQRRLVLIAFMSLGDSFADLAANPPSGSAAMPHWREARDMYQKSLQLMHEMRDAGVFDSSELKEIGEVAGKLANCESKLK